MYYFSMFLMTLLMVLGLFLIGLVLLQRGRGGGLAGAFGGMGGQSAFGTKAGDVFTRITIGVATVWILLCAGSVVALQHAESGRKDADIFAKEAPAGAGAGVDSKKAAPKDDPFDDPALTVPKSPADSTKTEKATEAPAASDAKDKVEPAPTDSKPAEPAPSDAKPAEDKSAETKPAEPKDPAPAPEKPAETAAGDQSKNEPKPETTPEKKPE